MVRRRSAQTLLAEVSATLASSLAADDILATVARQIGKAMGTFSCDIWDYEQGARQMTFVASWCSAEVNPYCDGVGHTAELDGWDTMLAVVEGRQTVELHADDRDLPLKDRASFDKWGFQTTIDTPLVCGDRVIGVLGLVETRELRRFTATERELFGQLGVQAAIAINNAHAFRRLEEQNRQLKAVREIGDALTSTLVFEEALQVMAREAAEALGVSRCIIDGFTDGEDVLTPLAAYERRPGGRRRAARLPAPRFCGSALLRRGPFVEQASDPRLDAAVRSEMAAEGELTSLNVPLICADRPHGLMHLIETRRERQFSAAEIDLARSIGEQVALAFQNERLYRSLREHADTDELTGLCTEHRFRERLYEEFVRARRYGLPLTLLMIGVDRFDAFTDTHGRASADEVLRIVAEVLRAGLRHNIDLAARFGEAEFAVMLPNTPPDDTGPADGLQIPPDATGLARAIAHRGGASAVAGRIRHTVQVATDQTADGAPPAVTVSIGVALLTSEMYDAGALVRAADAALVEARLLGRNTVVVAD
jgi:GGDEF domain-containing protein